MQEVPEQQDWNAFVQEHGPESGAFLQSWEWGVMQERLGHTVRRFRDGRTCALVTQRSLPFGQHYAYTARGPVAVDEDAAVDALVLLQGRLSDQMFLRAEPPVSIQKMSASQRVLDVGPDTTLMTSLLPDTPTLLANMHHKTRYNIRLAERKGVQVLLDAPVDTYLDVFVQLVAQTAARHGIRAHGRKHYETLLETLNGEGDGPRAYLSVASIQGQVVVAHLMLDWNGQRVYLHGASSDKHKKFMAPYLLHWELMQEAKVRGLTSYDWWGIAPEGADRHKLAGVTRLKKGFGGTVVSYAGTYDLPMQQSWYRFYRWVQRARGRNLSYN